MAPDASQRTPLHKERGAYPRSVMNGHALRIEHQRRFHAALARDEHARQQGGGASGGAKTHVLSLLKGLTKTQEVRLVCFMEGPFAQEAREMGPSGLWGAICI